MEERNFYILIASVAIALAVFWLTIYNIILLGIDPSYVSRNLLGPDEGEVIVTITGSGVKEDLELTMKDIKSDKYTQVNDREFYIEKDESLGGEPLTVICSGPTLWSILQEEGILKSSASTFTFYGADGYSSQDGPLPLSAAEDHEKDVILAYEEDGHPLFEDGPIRSVCDQSVMPDERPASRYWIKNLVKIEIE